MTHLLKSNDPKHKEAERILFKLKINYQFYFLCFYLEYQL